MTKYCTKESERLIGEKLQSIVELSVQAKHLITNGDSAMIVEHPLLSSTQCEPRENVSSNRVPVHGECWGSEGHWKLSSSG